MLTSAQSWLLVAALASHLVVTVMLVFDIGRLYRWAEIVDGLVGQIAAIDEGSNGD